MNAIVVAFRELFDAIIALLRSLDVHITFDRAV